MSPLLSRIHFRGLVIVAALIVVLGGPATAQTSSGSEGQPNDTATSQLAPKRGPARVDPARATHSNTVAPITKINSEAARNEPNSAGTQVESTPVIKKAGSAVVINIDKTNQKMTVFLDGIETYVWSISTGKGGYSTPSGTYTATSMNEIWYSKQWDNAPMPHSIFLYEGWSCDSRQL